MLVSFMFLYIIMYLMQFQIFYLFSFYFVFLPFLSLASGDFCTNLC